MFSMLKTMAEIAEKSYYSTVAEVYRKLCTQSAKKLHQNILLRNHSNLKTPSQHTAAYQSIQQKPDEALETYNTQYESYYQLAHPGLYINNDASRVSCIHYANSAQETW